MMITLETETKKNIWLHVYMGAIKLVTPSAEICWTDKDGKTLNKVDEYAKIVADFADAALIEMENRGFFDSPIEDDTDDDN